jgi:hypothetical protein
MGSGKVLRDAKQKYGVENFYKEIICFTNSRSGAKEVEELIVDEDMVKRPDCYNIAKGGRGGDTLAGADEEAIERWKQRLSEAHERRSPEDQTLTSQRMSEAQIKRYENMTPEERASLSKSISEARANMNPEDRALMYQNISEGFANMTPEENASWRKNISEGFANMTPEATALRSQRISEATSGSKHYRYVHLTQEQETFIKEKRNEGLSQHKIVKAFFETFNIKISRALIYRVLNNDI